MSSAVLYLILRSRLATLADRLKKQKQGKVPRDLMPEIESCLKMFQGIMIANKEIYTSMGVCTHNEEEYRNEIEVYNKRAFRIAAYYFDHKACLTEDICREIVISHFSIIADEALFPPKRKFLGFLRRFKKKKPALKLKFIADKITDIVEDVAELIM